MDGPDVARVDAYHFQDIQGDKVHLDARVDQSPFEPDPDLADVEES